MTDTKRIHEENRLSWNAATEAHNSHKLDQAAFLRDGGSTLFPEEIDLLGDLTGKRLVHLQCNSGQDTISLAALGADVLGVDISDSAIDFARMLSADSGIAARFVRADVYDWLDESAAAADRFDIVFSSYGAIPWLSDIARWAEGVAAILRPGGRFVLVEFHPFATSFDENWNLAYSYSAGGKPTTWEEGIGDYVAMAGEGLTPSGYVAGVEQFVNPHRVHEFFWGIGDVVSALAAAGLRLRALREYPYSNGAKLFNDMRETEGRRMIPPERLPSIPLMYGLVVEKR
jgi:SAM-dependent methyltransferase